MGTVVLSRGQSDRGMNLTTRLYLVPMLISGTIPLPPPLPLRMSSEHGQGQIYLLSNPSGEAFSTVIKPPLARSS